MAPHQVANLEGNKWIAFVDTEALSLKANVAGLQET
jgi:hypothetical protein